MSVRLLSSPSKLSTGVEARGESGIGSSVQYFFGARGLRTPRPRTAAKRAEAVGLISVAEYKGCTVDRNGSAVSVKGIPRQFESCIDRIGDDGET